MDNNRSLTAAQSIVLSHQECVLLDFDGPVSRLVPPPRNAEVAEQVRMAVPSGTRIPDSVTRSTDHLRVIWWATGESRETLRSVEDTSVRLEVEAARESLVTAGAAEFLAECSDRGTPVAIVSNNAVEAIVEFLRIHDLTDYIHSIVGRTYGHPERMKPETFIVDEALKLVGADGSRSVLVGDSVSDIVVATRVGTASVGLAKSNPRATELAEAGADVIVRSMRELLTGNR